MPDDPRTLQRLGLNLLRLREGLSLSQEQLAEKAELDRTYISGIERGVCNPMRKRLENIVSLGNQICLDCWSLTGGLLGLPSQKNLSNVCP